MQNSALAAKPLTLFAHRARAKPRPKIKTAAMTWDAATWIAIAKIALWFVAGTGVIAAFAFFVRKN
jgi:hypothetical protein